MSALALFGGRPVLSSESHRRWPIVGEEERRAIARVLDRGVLSGPFAPEARALEDEFASYVDARHCLLTHCGTSALLIALAASGVRAGDEVIVPAYSFVATPLAVIHVGAVPVFADVDVETGCLDPAAAEAAVTARTRAIMPVHMHGGAADFEALDGVARRHGLILVEDAAQAHGATHAGRPVGALGAAGGFSLQSSKNLAAGEGGLFVTNDEAIAREAASIRNFGQDVARSDASDKAVYDPSRPLDGTRPLESLRVGSMYRGNELMAAFARAQLARLPERTARCQANAERLSRALSELPGVAPPRPVPRRSSVHHKYRVHLDPRRAGLDLPRLNQVVWRDAVVAALRAEGLDVVLWQSAPLPAQGVFQRRDVSTGFPPAALPAALPHGGAAAAREGGTDLVANYDPARYPRTKALLDGSIVLFSQSCPLIAQPDDVVDRYAEAFRRVWEHRAALATWATRAS
ncbi:MAG: DegT/DnrJ/EryC1/StrS family aminotransferase [Myxococcales bacterium]|nr:DegT/DnrJ/EryC1/StrS family aminotransferase [Myxococcales bacterium]